MAVVGGGAGGCATALAAAAGGRRVLLVVKGALGDGATSCAQGGLAAVSGPTDTYAAHAADTLAAGAGLSDPAAVRALVRSAPLVIERLQALGARLDTDGEGHLVLGREGGHSHRRIVHAGGDASGAEVFRALSAALGASSVQVLEHTVAVDLLLDERSGVGGLQLACLDKGVVSSQSEVRAKAVVLATGGAGQVYAQTSNPAGATGDGLALAARAGASLVDVEFVQFHPTLLWARSGGGGGLPLITEALRGEGAVLIDAAGRPVMAGVHPAGDLAPRDVVAAAMHARMIEDGVANLWLDATRLGRAALSHRFPTVLANCSQAGVDPVREPIPVAPGAHYFCGGVRTDLTGSTDVAGLFAVGEVAGTGLHGANRLASNSLTEALAGGWAIGRQLAASLPSPAFGRLHPSPPLPYVDPAARPMIAAAMSHAGGLLRSPDGLTGVLGLLAGLAGPRSPGTPATLAEIEVANLHLVATGIATAALARRESRGCHRRADAPGTSAKWAGRLRLRLDAGKFSTQLDLCGRAA